MAKQRSDKGSEWQAREAPEPRRPAGGTNGRLAEQTRKLLGRHYAARYPGRRSV